MVDTQAQVVVGRLNGLHVEDGHTFGLGGHLLTIFPLRGERQGQFAYVTLEEAIGDERLTIGELDEPQVNALVVNNRGNRPVLITDGDTLVGGHQNRVVNSTVLVPPGEMALPVSCVERGRWRPDAKSFSVSESAYPTLRRAKSSQVVRSLRAGERHQADQGAIWHEVAARQAAASVRSATEALRDLYANRHARLTAYVRALPCPRNTVGVIVGYGGRIVSLELFDSPEILEQRWSRLIRAAALDALVSKPAAAISKTRAIRMLHRPQRADVLRFTTPGLGTDLRLAGGGVEGAALLHDEIVVHAVLHRVAA